jgi:hypothetical protein
MIPFLPAFMSFSALTVLSSAHFSSSFNENAWFWQTEWEKAEIKDLFYFRFLLICRQFIP